MKEPSPACSLTHRLRDALASGELDAHGYFQQLLRLVYRLIFLLTVEERGQLHPSGADPQAVQLYAEGYGLRRLRDSFSAGGRVAVRDVRRDRVVKENYILCNDRDLPPQ